MLRPALPLPSLLASLRRWVPARLWAYGLLLALLVAPLLGTLHMVMHPQAVPGAPGTQALHAAAVAATAATAADPGGMPGAATAANAAPARPATYSWLDRLFGHQAGGNDCRLFDQLCQGHALPSVPMLLAVLLPPAAVFVFFQLGRIVQRDALFHARAPPALR